MDIVFLQHLFTAGIDRVDVKVRVRPRNWKYRDVINSICSGYGLSGEASLMKGSLQGIIAGASEVTTAAATR